MREVRERWGTEGECGEVEGGGIVGMTDKATLHT